MYRKQAQSNASKANAKIEAKEIVPAQTMTVAYFRDTGILSGLAKAAAVEKLGLCNYPH